MKEVLNNMSCPMTKDVPLTDEEIAKFCNLGCSVDCDKFLAEYIEKRDAKKMQVVNVNAQVIPECCYQCSNLHVDPFKPSICSLGMALPIKKQSCKRMNMQIREAVQLPIPKGKRFEKAIISLLCQSNQWCFGIDLMTKTSGHYFGPNPSRDKPYERIANELNSLGVDIGELAYCIDEKTRPEIKDALRELVYLKTIKILHAENSRIIFEPSSLAIEIAYAIIDEFTLKSVSYYINSFGEIIYPNLENYRIGTMIVQHGNEKLPAAEIGIPEQ